MSDGLGLVDFALGLVIFVLNLPGGLVLFWGNSERVLGLVEMTCGLNMLATACPNSRL